MTGLSWGELLVVGIVALIVVGPKELPVMFRNIGRFVGKARGMAREFSRAMNDAADDAGVKDVAKTLKTATNPVSSAMDGVKDAARSMTDLDTGKADKPKIDPNSATGKLSAERDAARKKIEASAARKAAERQAREAEAAMKRAEQLEADLADAEALNAADASKADTTKAKS